MTHSGLKIAVCGHRRLSDQGRLEISILAAAARIRAVFPGRRYQVCSCLAEGADRLLARKLAETLPADLTVVLPLPEREYLKDFQTEESIQEYRNLRLRAKDVIPPSQEETRPQAYRAANRYLVENCDLLVAIWDGEPAHGPGGTGETVEMFRQAGRPLLWIHASQGPLTGSLVEERLESLS